MEAEDGSSEIQNCLFRLRVDPKRRKDKVYVGCGAGFGGDRPVAALRLLERVQELDYLVLECLAERTLAERYQIMVSGGKGYDTRISDWMLLLLPLAMEKGVCIITNMGAMEPLGAQEVVLDVAMKLGLKITVSVVYESALYKPELHPSSEGYPGKVGGTSAYLGAAPIVQCLELYNTDVVITSRVADASLFLAPMVYELGWNWNDFDQLAQGTVAGHLLECGCQLTGGYFMHPGDKYRDFSLEQLLDISLPYAEIGYGGDVCLAKAEGTGGLLNCSTCAEQLLYEIGDPASYITPDVVIDLRHVYFCQLTNHKVLFAGSKPSDFKYPDRILQLIPMDYGWKGWGEISYGGYGCFKRAEAAEFLVRSWMDEVCPGVEDCIVSYVIGHDSLKTTCTTGNSAKELTEVRLRMDGLFERKESADCFIKEFIALYTNGPAGGGGINTGIKKEIILEKQLVEREDILWQTKMRKVSPADSQSCTYAESALIQMRRKQSIITSRMNYEMKITHSEAAAAAPSGEKILLYQVAHGRAGDKGNDLNFSIIPHCPTDIDRLRKVITPDWVMAAVSPLLVASPFSDPQAVRKKHDQLDSVRVEIYEVPGIHSLNVVVRNILDGGVNCSRRIDRHGKTISDLILCQEVVLPP